MSVGHRRAAPPGHRDEKGGARLRFVTLGFNVARILRSHTHDHHSTGDALRKDVALFVDELKIINVIRPNTNTDAFAEKIVANVIT
ncbi:hypothetical protein [Brucella pituitosa]|uniref:hypothetical protein n=1 Tax=Brucella pituitosa TaxID=571256 RepID=UPI003F4A9836